MAKAKTESVATKPKTHREDPLLDPKEAATQLGMQSDTLGRWMRPDAMGRRRIKSVRLPSGRRKIRQSTVNQILLGTGTNGDATEEVSYEEIE